MVEVVTKLNIESAPHDNIISFIDNPSLVSDPRAHNATTRTRQFVYDSDPLMKSVNFGYFPYIIVRGSSLTYSGTSSNGKFKTLNWSNEIVVRTLRDGAANSRSDVGRVDMQNICNQLQNLFNEENNKQQLRALNMYKLNLERATGDNTLIVQQRPVLEVIYTLSYTTRLQVSA